MDRGWSKCAKAEEHSYQSIVLVWSATTKSIVCEARLVYGGVARFWNMHGAIRSRALHCIMIRWPLNSLPKL